MWHESGATIAFLVETIVVSEKIRLLIGDGRNYDIGVGQSPE